MSKSHIEHNVWFHSHTSSVSVFVQLCGQTDHTFSLTMFERSPPLTSGAIVYIPISIKGFIPALATQLVHMRFCTWFLCCCTECKLCPDIDTHYTQALMSFEQFCQPNFTHKALIELWHGLQALPNVATCWDCLHQSIKNSLLSQINYSEIWTQDRMLMHWPLDYMLI